MSSESIFKIEKNFDLLATLDKARLGTWQHASSVTSETIYYDTFDWRLHANNTCLTLEKTPQHSQLNWIDSNTGGIHAWQRTETTPDFQWNLHAGPIKELISPLIDVRRLLPFIILRRRVQPYTLVNEDNKIILRVYKESVTAIKPTLTETSGPLVKRKPLGYQLRVQALKGYTKTYTELVRHFKKQYQLNKAENPFQKALTAHSVQPGNYSSKLKLKLDPDKRSDASVKEFLAILLEAMERNENGIEADIDAEFLHDFRVAGRRSRSAIGQIKSIMPARVLERLNRDFSWLNQTSGPARDMDVYLLGFPDYQACLPKKIRPDLKPLREFLSDHKQAEYKKLIHALHSARYRHFKEYLRKYIEQPVTERTTLSHAKEPIVEVSAHRIWRVFRRVIKEGKAINKKSPNEELHELRKTCKKLRYLLEFCRSLHPKKDINRLIKALKQLQDNLGEFQDFSVQIDALHHFSEQMIEEKRADEKSLAAMDKLIGILDERQHETRKIFHQRFKNFSAKENQDIFKRLFKPTKLGNPRPQEGK